MHALLISIFCLLFSTSIHPISLQEFVKKKAEAEEDVLILDSGILSDIFILDLSHRELDDINGIDQLYIRYRENGPTFSISTVKNLCLKLNNNNLKKLPSGIVKLNLYGLDVSSNHLEKMPFLPRTIRSLMLRNNCLRNDAFIYFAQLENLEWLYLSDNVLTEIPNTVCYCTKLKILDVSNNALASINPLIRQLTLLQELNVANNYFNSLPEGICVLSLLTKLVVDRKKIQLSDDLENFLLKVMVDGESTVLGDEDTTLPEDNKPPKDDSWSLDSDDDTVEY